MLRTFYLIGKLVLFRKSVGLILVEGKAVLRVDRHELGIN
jgi:hypothetical protein